MKSSPFFTPFRMLCGWIVLWAGAAVAYASPPPSGTVGVAYSYQISTTPAAAAGTVYAATNLPPGLGIGSSTGLVSGTPTAAGTYSGVFSLTANSLTNNLSFTITIAAGAGAPVLGGTTTATGTVGTAFAGYTPTVTSNAATSFNVTGLPPGLSADPTTGIISGTPTASGTYPVSISGNNGAGTGGVFTLTITVAAAAGAPAINSASTLAALPGVALSPAYQITTVGSNATSYAASGLPVGLSLDTTAGTISGTPSAAGTYTVTLTATNAAGTSAAFTLTATIGAVVTNSTTASATAGTPFTLTLTSSTPSASITSYNVTGLPSGLTATSGGVISGTPTTAGTYLVSVSANTAGGTGPSVTITLAVAAASGGGGGGGSITPVPTITAQPAPVTVTAGSTANFAVTATSSTNGGLTYQWLYAGNAIAGQTASTLSLANVQTGQSGLYSVVVTATGGTSVSSSTALLTVNPPVTVTPVTITSQPATQSVSAGTTVTFTVAASGSGTLTYQWSKNGAAISGATTATYTITNVGAADAASYGVTVSNGTSSATSNLAVLTVTPAVVSRLVNVSVSGTSGLVPQNLVVGLSIGGTGSKSVLIRAVGPTLGAFGVPGVLASPQLTLNSGLVQIGANAGWGGTAALSQAFLQTGAFALPATSLDAALLMSLASGATYSANVTGANSTTGVVLLEAYDADTAAVPTARFVNLSARGVAGSGSNVMTIGFVIGGNAPKSLLLRGIGPSLAGFGLSGVLPTTQLSLFSKAGASIASNTGWGGTAALTSAFNAVGAFSLPATSADSALLVTLQPGTYTAQLTGAGSSTASGVALLELYDLQ